MPQVYLPDESEERLHRGRMRRVRLWVTVASVLTVLVLTAWFVFGPYRERRARLADGFRSEVVPGVPKVGPSDSAWASRRAPYRIQVTSLESRDKASEVATKLRVDGWDVNVVEDSVSHRFLVQVGPYVQRAQAEQVARKLRDGWGPGVILIERN